jgi:hypothetical protein
MIDKDEIMSDKEAELYKGLFDRKNVSCSVKEFVNIHKKDMRALHCHCSLYFYRCSICTFEGTCLAKQKVLVKLV